MIGNSLNTGTTLGDNIFLCQEKGISDIGLVDYKLISGTNPNIKCPTGYDKNEVNLKSGVPNR